MHTAFGKIAHLTQTTVDVPSPLQNEIATLSRVIAVLAVAIGLIVFAIGRFIGLSLSASIVFAIGIIVANVPEGLPADGDAGDGHGRRRMARRNMLVRHLPSVEALGSAAVICTDKTGTLDPESYGDPVGVRGRQVSRSGGRADGGFAGSHRRFLECAACCHDLKATGTSGRGRWIGDPMELALDGHGAPGRSGSRRSTASTRFPSSRSASAWSPCISVSDATVLFVKGAPEEVVSRARWVDVEGRSEPWTVEGADRFNTAATEMADRGLRVLAFAHRVLPPTYVLDDAEQDLVVTALVGFEDPPRAEVPAAVGRVPCGRHQDHHGDRRPPAYCLAVARAIGLVTGSTATLLTERTSAGCPIRSSSLLSMQRRSSARESRPIRNSASSRRFSASAASWRSLEMA
jgi:magnesium-transporting ATPase (P-type)